MDAFLMYLNQSLDEIQKAPEEFWVAYAGTIGTSYDIRTMILAADLLKQQGYSDIHIKILGGGPLQEELEQFIEENRSIMEAAKGN